MTGRDEQLAPAAAPAAGPAPSPTELPLPPATVGGMAGLLEILAAAGGREDLPELADALNFEVDDLLPLVDGTVLLGLATVDHADLELTDAGRSWVGADILTSKELFAEQARAPLVRAISRSLAATEDGTLNQRFFLDLLRHGFSEEEARRQLDLAIDWGRYGELFDYDADSGELVLDPAAGTRPTA
jgi:NitT/TauT family transport system ATP-binding protein